MGGRARDKVDNIGERGEKLDNNDTEEQTKGEGQVKGKGEGKTVTRLEE